MVYVCVCRVLCGVRRVNGVWPAFRNFQRSVDLLLRTFYVSSCDTSSDSVHCAFYNINTRSTLTRHLSTPAVCCIASPAPRPAPSFSFALSLLRSFAPSLLRSFAPSLLHSFTPLRLRSFAPSSSRRRRRTTLSPRRRRVPSTSMTRRRSRRRTRTYRGVQSSRGTGITGKNTIQAVFVDRSGTRARARAMTCRDG